MNNRSVTRNSFTFTASFLLLILASFFTNQSKAQWSSGKYMKQAFVRTINYAKNYESSSSTFGFAKGLSFLGTFLDASGGKSNFTLDLKSDKTYVIMGGGDDDATDVDIKISKDGVTLASDTKTDNLPSVTFSPSYSGRYVLTLSNYAKTKAYCCLVILESGGLVLNTDRMKEAQNSMFALASIVNEVSTTGVAFQSKENSWCVYGYLLEQGTDNSIYGMPLRDGSKHYLVAVGDDSVKDIDLCATVDGTETSCNKEMDATPLVTISKATSSSTYGFRVKNIKSEHTGFVLVSILRE
ncbi:hypothetical protein LK994_13265 [Ferruginibacter lapsinanis]|uniref:hypothetical protein n=1 Tax=Ferruginibacter lapsinanis TaxID=563172 RepID=UPI001E3D9622|nr:hypothetical protein [Ferruginibacter lapsinanis]UEG49605.1 hypothetical protein LK994_13265 [Ferruginibacter lapsinanis]